MSPKLTTTLIGCLAILTLVSIAECREILPDGPAPKELLDVETALGRTLTSNYLSFISSEASLSKTYARHLYELAERRKAGGIRTAIAGPVVAGVISGALISAIALSSATDNTYDEDALFDEREARVIGLGTFGVIGAICIIIPLVVGLSRADSAAETMRRLAPLLGARYAWMPRRAATPSSEPE